MTRTAQREQHSASGGRNRPPAPQARPGAPGAAGAWRRRIARTALKAAVLAALLLPLPMEPPGALANSYTRGNLICRDFKDAERDYRSDPENINRRIGYAFCFLTKGDDSQGMAILHNIVDNSTEPERVKAAWMVAEYISTGGTFENTTDENNIIEAIEAYKRIVFFIDLDPYYPVIGNSLYEEESQIELRTNYRIPMLYFDKFMYGAQGTHNMHLLRSPSYEGEQDLSAYPRYSPYTIDSLEQMIEFADQCLALPPKRHFQSDHYKNHKAGCQVFKEAATALLPLEYQRLVLLDTNSCSDDLPQCLEYQEIKSEIVSIIRQAISENKKNFSVPAG